MMGPMGEEEAEGNPIFPLIVKSGHSFLVPVREDERMRRDTMK